MLSPPLRIAASRNSSATAGCPPGPPAALCSPTCSPTKPTIAAKFSCSPTSSATASSTKLPTSGNGKNSGNKPALPPAPADLVPPRLLAGALFIVLRTDLRTHFYFKFRKRQDWNASLTESLLPVAFAFTSIVGDDDVVNGSPSKPHSQESCHAHPQSLRRHPGLPPAFDFQFLSLLLYMSQKPRRL